MEKKVMGKKFGIIPILCCLAVIFITGLFFLVNHNSRDNGKIQKDKDGRYIITEERIKKFEIENYANPQYQYVYGVATEKIDNTNPDSLSLINDNNISIYTSLINDKKIISYFPTQNYNYSISKDATRLFYFDDSRAGYCTDIMMYDTESNQTKKINNDTIEGYESKYFKTMNVFDGIMNYCLNQLKISDDNSLLAYESDRRIYDSKISEPRNYTVTDGNYVLQENTGNTMDIWIIDLSSGSEYLFLEDARLQRWDGRNLVYMQNSLMYFMNIDTKEVKTIPEGFSNIEIGLNYIIDCSMDVLKIYNITTGEASNYTIIEEGLRAINKQIIKSDDGKDYAIITYTNGYLEVGQNKKYYCGIIDLSSGNKKIFIFPNEENENENENLNLNDNMSAPVIVGLIGNNKIIIKHGIYAYSPKNTNYALIDLGDVW